MSGRGRRVRSALKRYLGLLGPGLVTGAADDDPSGITTYSIVGASHGYDLLWTAVLSTPLMIAVQLICARVGLASGQGVIGAARGHVARWVLALACILLLLANGFNIGADLAGMAEVTELPAWPELYCSCHSYGAAGGLWELRS